jgi:hypothetical protein
MKNHVPTIILCFPADPAESWFARGDTRGIAEGTYLSAIAQEKAKPPLYRIVCQYKVDQYEATTPLSAYYH